MIKILMLATFFALLTGAGASPPTPTKVVTNVDPGAAAKLVTVKVPEKQAVIILDVRTPREFRGVRITKSKNINFVGDTFEEDLAKLDKHKPYLVLCQSGYRSQQSLAAFKKLGFTKIYHLDGGILAWIKHGLPVDR